MDDLISRQAAIAAANRADYRGLTVEDVKKVTDEVVKELKQLPSAQPERKKGKWIRFSADGFHCKECGATFCVIQGEDKMNFCPNCRTEMSGGDPE